MGSYLGFKGLISKNSFFDINPCLLVPSLSLRLAASLNSFFGAIL